MGRALLVLSASLVLFHALPAGAGEQQQKSEFRVAYERSLNEAVASSRKPRLLTVGAHLVWVVGSAAGMVFMPEGMPWWMYVVPGITVATAPSWGRSSLALAGWRNGSLKEKRRYGGWARVILRGAEKTETLLRAGAHKLLERAERRRGLPRRTLLGRFHLGR